MGDLPQPSFAKIRQDGGFIQKGNAAVFQQKLYDGVHTVELRDTGKGRQGDVVKF